MTIEIDGASIYVVDQGNGPPTLFLHGNPDSADMWQPLITPLQTHLRCLALDLPGFARSSVPASFDYTLAGMARVVDQAVAALGLREPINLVLHDFGGHFGLAWAIEHQTQVRRIVVSNTNFFSDYRWHGMARLLRTPIIGDLLTTITTGASLRTALRQAAPRLPDEHLQRVAAQYAPSTGRMALRLYRAGHPRQFVGWEDRLRQMTAQVPTMVIWGDRDPFAPASLADRFGAQQVIHEADFSHWVLIENAPAVAERLTTFLA